MRITPAGQDPSPAGAYHDARALQLIDTAKARGLTWAAIGATLGMTGPEAKRHARKLRTQARKAKPRA